MKQTEFTNIVYKRLVDGERLDNMYIQITVEMIM